MKKISELTVKKEVSRIKFDENRNRYRENLVFDVRYNPTEEDVESRRTQAKIIDVLIGIVLSFIILVLIALITKTYNPDLLDVLAMSIIIVVVMNSLLEHFFGKSIGKFFRKIRVISDEAQNPSIVQSFKRNFLTVVHVLSGFRYKPTYALEPLPLRRNQHNAMCKTYIINENKLEEIKNLLID